MPTISDVSFYNPISDNTITGGAEVINGAPVYVRIIFDFLPTDTITITIFEDDFVSDDMIATYTLVAGAYSIQETLGGWIVDFTGWTPDLSGGSTPEYYADVSYDILSGRSDIINVITAASPQLIDVKWDRDGPLSIGDAVSISATFDLQPTRSTLFKILEQDTTNEDLVATITVNAAEAHENNDGTWTVSATWIADYLGESGDDDARYEIRAEYDDQNQRENTDLIVLSPQVDLVDAYWADPDVDYQHGTLVTMIAQFDKAPETDTIFEVFENDLIGDDKVAEYIVSADQATLGEDGYWYIEAFWTAHYSGDIFGSAEYIFDVSYDGQREGENSDIKVIGDPIYTAPVTAYELALLANHVYEDAFRIADVALDALDDITGETVFGWSIVADNEAVAAFNNLNTITLTGVPLAETWDYTGFDAKIYEHPDQNAIVLSIAGTDLRSIEDLLTDLSIVLTDVQSLFETVPDQTLNAYLYATLAASYAESQGKELVLTGHSLGGALASLLSAQGFGEAVVFNAADATPWIERIVDGHTYDTDALGALLSTTAISGDIAFSVGVSNDAFEAAFNVTLTVGDENTLTLDPVQNWNWGEAAQAVYGYVINNELLEFLGYDYSFGQPPDVIDLNHASSLLDIAGKLDNHAMDLVILALAGEDEAGNLRLEELSNDLPWIVDSFLGALDIAGDVLGATNTVLGATVIGELVRDALLHPEKLVLDALFDELSDYAFDVASDQLSDEDVRAFAENAILEAWSKATGDTDVPNYVQNILTDVSDKYTGNNSGELIAGFAGNDTLFGAAGNDLIYGGSGHDVLRGDGGADIVSGDVGNDTIFAGRSDDAPDIIFGGNGNDVIGGGPGDDLLIGDGTSAGIDGNTDITDDGFDTLFGGVGNDTLIGGGWDDINGDNVFTIDEILDDLLAANTIWAGLGDDLIFAANGNDIIGGGAGDDTLYAGAGADTIFGGVGDDNDSGNNDVIYANEGNDIIYGAAGNDFINAGYGQDIIYGGDGDDTVVASAGHDTLWIGAGDDHFTLGAGQDFVGVINGGGNDTITDFIITDDRLELGQVSDYNPNNGLEAYAQAHTENSSLGIRLEFEGTSLFLVGLSMSDVSLITVSLDQ